MFNKFDEKTSINLLEENEISSSLINSFSITNCEFINEKDDESSSMIYYINGNETSDIEINGCNFKGKLAKGSHYIDAKMHEKDKPRFQIKSCHFEYDENNSVNIELVNDLLLKGEFISSNFLRFDGKIVLKRISFLTVCIFTTLLISKRLRSNDKNKDYDIWEENFNEVEFNKSSTNDMI